jgi:cell division protein FtsQ
LKRPQSKPAAKASASLPTAPKTQRPSAKKTSSKRSSSKQVQRLKSPVDSKREQKKLLRIRKSNRKLSFFSRLSPEARRFTAKSRQRKTLLLIVISSFGALLLLVLATIFTPLLAVEKIEVGGVKRLKDKSIINALTSQMGKPLPLISPSEIAKALEAFPLIESFSIVSLPPHTLKIQVAERQPIGVISVAGTSYLYDPAGVRIGIATGSEKLPSISIKGAPEESKEFDAAIEVLMALPASLLERVSEINAKSKDDVTLRLRGYAGQRIIWGDGSDSVLKSKVLDALVANQKKTDRVTFDVSSPNAPVVLYGIF